MGARRESDALPTIWQIPEDLWLIVRAVLGDVVTLCPPLIIDATEIDELFDKLTRALDKTQDWVARERLAQIGDSDEAPKRIPPVDDRLADDRSADGRSAGDRLADDPLATAAE